MLRISSGYKSHWFEPSQAHFLRSSAQTEYAHPKALVELIGWRKHLRVTPATACIFYGDA
jgi:hypothetical protein